MPAPFDPMSPTMAPGGTRKERSSIKRRSSKPLEMPSASRTRPPRRGPAGNHDLCLFTGLFEFFGMQGLVGTDSRLTLRLARPGRLADPIELTRERTLACLLLFAFALETRLLLFEP